MTNSTPSLPPGFRFHPTDEELILHYLRNHAASSPCPVSIVAEVDIYKSDPWDLPKKAMYGDREWYFFSPRDRKYPNGVRPNRAAGSGYWKATGTDKPIVSSKEGSESIGVKKALVFYRGKPPKGIKTNWIMHEYRLAESSSKNNTRRPMKLKDSSMRLDDWVLCRIYQKSSHVQEDSSTGHETELPNLPGSPLQESKLYLPKSASMTELFKEADFSLLSRLLEAPIETPLVTQAHDSFGGYATTNWNQPLIYNTNQVPEAEHYSVSSSSSFAMNNGSKRQRVWEEGGNMFQYPSNSSNYFSSSNSSSSAPWAYNKFSSQAFLNQQLLLETHLGMQ